MYRKVLLHGIQLLFVSLFLYTGVEKVFNFAAFSSELKQSPILKSLAGLFMWLIPGIELFIVILLLYPAWRLKGLYASFALLILFTIYLFILRYLTDYIPCDCGGFLENIPSDLHILLDLFLSVFAMMGIALERRTRNVSQGSLIDNFNNRQ
jgi:hypothetical protein